MHWGASDGKFVTSEFSLVFAYLGVPWKSKANLSMCRSAGRELFRSFNHHFELYRTLYERLVRGEYRNSLPLGFGAESHIEDFWCEVQEDPILTAIDTS